MTRVAIYGRVSTADKDQDPETQLIPLREFAAARAWQVIAEKVDQASALDMARRHGWAEVLALASRHKYDVLLVWRMDRAFRSVPDAANTLERLRSWGVGLRSYAEPWLDTTSPFGEALYYITVAYAGLERGILRERVKAGMERARRQGRRIGRPRGSARPGFAQRLAAVQARLAAGEVSRRQAAMELGIGYTTLTRALAGPRPEVTAGGPGHGPAAA